MLNFTQYLSLKGCYYFEIKKIIVVDTNKGVEVLSARYTTEST